MDPNGARCRAAAGVLSAGVPRSHTAGGRGRPAQAGGSGRSSAHGRAFGGGPGRDGRVAAPADQRQHTGRLAPTTIERFMLLPVHARVRARLSAALTAHFGLAEADLPAIVIETPPRRAMGDLAVPVAFELARQLRKAPKMIAQDLAAKLGGIEGIDRVEAANGYLNFYLARKAFATAELAAPGAAAGD